MSRPPELAGKVAIVTGGASGLGRGMVELFVEEGADVVVADVNVDAGEAFAAELGPSAAFKRTDVAMADDVQAAVDFAVERFGGLHVMCNNAGIGGSFKRFLDDDFDDFDRVMKVNIFGVMVGSQRAARHMVEHGGGAIVNTTSIGGINAGSGVMAYRATKAAVIHITRSIAVELAAKSIRVNCIAPAHIPTPINEKMDQSLIVRAMQPLQRVGSPRDVAEAALYLASDRAAQITGVVLPVDGGTTAGNPPIPIKDLMAAPAAGAAVNTGKAMDIYSCDDHLDLSAVPPGLWESRLSAADAVRGPRVEKRDKGSVWICEDAVMGRSGMPPNAEFVKKFSAIGRAGIEDDGYRAGTPALRLEDLDRDGVAASVIYGPLSLGFPIKDPALQSACYAAWNDWAIEEFNAVDPDRLCILAFLPSHSPEVAAAELRRCATRGHRGAIVGVFDIDVGDPAWDVLWAAAQETGLPISFHIKGGTSSKLSYQIGKWQSAAFATLLPLQLDEPLATMVFCGALERHPGLKLVLAESGVGWLPYFLTRMDLEWHALRDKLDYAPSLAPSELFRRQVIATFEEESLAEQFIPMLGADSCMWASDYPHTDSTFPESRRAIEQSLGKLAHDDRRKITATNSAQLYGFPHE